MNFQYIVYFVTLAEEKNFTNAAKRVGVVQSTFSAGIRKLEESLGRTLFYRDKRKVALTKGGIDLLPYAQQILHNWKMMLSPEQEENRLLRLGVVFDIDYRSITEVLKNYHKEYPKTVVKLIEGNIDELERQLNKGEIDGLLHKSIFNNKSLKTTLIRRDKLVLAVGRGHHLHHFDSFNQAQ